MVKQLETTNVKMYLPFTWYKNIGKIQINKKDRDNVTKTRKSMALTMLAVLCMLLIVIPVLLTGCANNKKSWNISINSDSNVNAELLADGDNYKLTIFGSGYMKFWKSANDVPWHESVSKITKIEIANGVTAVGSYAFYGINVDSVVLPESIVDVGESVVSDGVALFAYSDDIYYADNYPIYLYKQDIPQSFDRFWQQDKSKGDIFTDADELIQEEGNFWHYQGDKAVILNKIKILFVGNSFTYRNGVVDPSSGVPGIFDNIAEDLGYWVETYSITGPGWYLKNHAKSTDACGKQIDKLLNARSDFDYVVLQEQSLNPIQNYNDFLNGVKAMQEKINATQDHAQIYLYETWGSPYSANDLKTTIPEMEKALRDAYTNAGAECGLPVSYVGKAFNESYTNDTSIYLWDTDNRHQGYTGAYLSACVHVATILGGDVRNTTFKGEAQYKAPDLPEETLTSLRNTAYNVAFGLIDDEPTTPDNPENPENPEQPTHEYSLEIAIWGRWMTEEQFVALFDGFKQYCSANGLDASKIHYTYYTGATTSDPYYYIANFTGAVVANGGADIVFPCATNLTTQDGTQITQAEIAELHITLNGKTDRCVAKLTDTELANAFFNYCLSDEGKAILQQA